MPEVTYYVALPLVAAAGDAVECFKPNAAAMKAEALSRKPGIVGAVAVQPPRGSRDGVFRGREAAHCANRTATDPIAREPED